MTIAQKLPRNVRIWVSLSEVISGAESKCLVICPLNISIKIVKIFFDMVCKSPALAGCKGGIKYSLRGCVKALPWLVGRRKKYSLRGCVKLCPDWLADYSSFQPARAELFTPSQRIFYSSSQPGQKYFWHLQKILNSFGQSGESFSNPLMEYFISQASQPGQSTLMPFQTIIDFPSKPERAYFQ